MEINFCNLTQSESLHPLGGRWRVAPDEGYLGQNAAVLRPHQSPAVTASPDRGKPSCGKLISVQKRVPRASRRSIPGFEGTRYDSEFSDCVRPRNLLEYKKEVFFTIL